MCRPIVPSVLGNTPPETETEKAGHIGATMPQMTK